MEGTLNKWTNVMKGWQYRWFVLDELTGILSYFTVSLKLFHFIQCLNLLLLITNYKLHCDCELLLCSKFENSKSAKWEGQKVKSHSDRINEFLCCCCFIFIFIFFFYLKKIEAAAYIGFLWLLALPYTMLISWLSPFYCCKTFGRNRRTNRKLSPHLAGMHRTVSC